MCARPVPVSHLYDGTKNRPKKPRNTPKTVILAPFRHSAAAGAGTSKQCTFHLRRNQLGQWMASFHPRPSNAKLELLGRNWLNFLIDVI